MKSIPGNRNNNPNMLSTPLGVQERTSPVWREIEVEEPWGKYIVGEGISDNNGHRYSQPIPETTTRRD